MTKKLDPKPGGGHFILLIKSAHPEFEPLGIGKKPVISGFSKEPKINYFAYKKWRFIRKQKELNRFRLSDEKFEIIYCQ